MRHAETSQEQKARDGGCRHRPLQKRIAWWRDHALLALRSSTSKGALECGLTQVAASADANALAMSKMPGAKAPGHFYLHHLTYGTLLEYDYPP
ncbi:hypothetical protein HY971_01315 [Candidatus Kaiserbacteria bacterium]|nr:hypothetical protein [Candidatus Kaiserbacteria bacterium]